jgi:signal transduction histidine kinase
MTHKNNFSRAIVHSFLQAAKLLFYPVFPYLKAFGGRQGVRAAKVITWTIKNFRKDAKKFINIAAHELRTPVQSILGAARKPSEEVGSKKERIQIIARNAKILEWLMQDIVDVTRTNTGFRTYCGHARFERSSITGNIHIKCTQ